MPEQIPDNAIIVVTSTTGAKWFYTLADPERRLWWNGDPTKRLRREIEFTPLAYEIYMPWTPEAAE